MDVRGFTRAVRKRWIGVVVGIVIGVLVAVVGTTFQSNTYSSSVSFFISTPSVGSGSAFEANQYAENLVNSYVKLLGSDALAQDLIDNEGLTGSAHDIAAKISGSASLNTVVLNATVTDSTASSTNQIARALSAGFGSFVGKLTTTNGQAPRISLRRINGPTPVVRVSPQRKLNYALGLLVGIVLSLAYAAVRELTDTSLRSTEQLAASTLRPVLGRVARAGRRDSPRIVPGSRAQIAEDFRHQRTALQFVHVDEPVHVIAVTSAVAGEGKSSYAINLAQVFAELRRSVLVIDCDLRRPRLGEYLGVDATLGLSDVLAGRVSLDDVLQSAGPGGLTVLPSGSIPPNPSELLGSQQMIDLVKTLRTRFDMIVIDTPPLLPVTDGAVVARVVDGAIVVVRHGKTSVAQLTEAVASLDAVDAAVLGTVLTMTPLERTDRSVYVDADADRIGGAGATPPKSPPKVSSDDEEHTQDGASSPSDTEQHPGRGVSERVRQPVRTEIVPQTSPAGDQAPPESTGTTDRAPDQTGTSAKSVSRGGNGTKLPKDQRTELTPRRRVRRRHPSSEGETSASRVAGRSRAGRQD